MMGTPLLFARAKLRAKRARVAFSTILPATGMRIFIPSHLWRPNSVLIYERNAKIAPSRINPCSHQVATMNSENPISMRVISGNWALKPA